MARPVTVWATLALGRRVPLVTIGFAGLVATVLTASRSGAGATVLTAVLVATAALAVIAVLTSSETPVVEASPARDVSFLTVRSGDIERFWDFQDAVLIGCGYPGGSGQWLWVARRGAGSGWATFRRSLHKALEAKTPFPDGERANRP